MFYRYNRSENRRKRGEFRSNVEREISKSLTTQGLDVSYETANLDYFQKRRYTPDFVVKGHKFTFYIEVKGYWASEDRSKFLAVVTSNPHINIFVALQKPLQKINKNSKTRYCDWAAKYGIAWCPIPIPEDFLQSWVNGHKLTFPVPTQTGAAVQEAMQLTATAKVSVSNAIQPLETT